MSDQEKKKQELLDLLAQAPEKAERLESLGRTIQQSAQLAREVAAPTREIMSEVPAESLPPEEWGHQVSVWTAWLDDASKLERSATLINTFGATSYAVTSTSGSVVSVVAGSSILTPTPRTKAARSQLNQVLKRTPLMEGARLGIRRLKLDQREGDRRTPMELLEEARSSFGSGPTSDLIPMRECILATTAELVRRRATQEPTGRKFSEKMATLAGQCARDGLPATHFEVLGADGDRLLDDLSKSKQAGLSREEVSELFYRSLALLNALLDSIDETRLRS